MKKVTIIVFLITNLLILSCQTFISGKITVQITKGSGNNYYEIEIYSNSNLSVNNTNTFIFSFQDQNNTILEISTGRLENGFSSWTSYKTYTRGVYIVVVKIDETGDNQISQGDSYSYKYVTVNEDNQPSLSFSSSDNWYGM